MNRQLPADDAATSDQPSVTAMFTQFLRSMFTPNEPAHQVANLRVVDEKADNDQARRLVAVAQINQVYRALVSRKVRATTRLLALALALFLFAVLSPTPQPWAFIALGAVLACAVGRARQAGSLGISRRRQVHAALRDVRAATAS
uniref:hypothetical protein n=1 Tax=Amycolatopsis sp. CA-082387 TaxID=3239918 RepID=UPI003F498DCC